MELRRDEMSNAEPEPVTWDNFDIRYPQLVAQVARMEQVLDEMFGPKGQSRVEL